MKIYILGICGTFMAGIAMLAREKGYQVVGSDANVYPPMSTQLEQAGIEIREGYSTDNLDETADLFVVGNAMSRGNEQIEAILNKNLPYISGPQWLYEHLLKDRWVLAVAGTHGKTSTSSMLAWILEYSNLQPGFLIGGLTQNFNTSARLGESPFFVIEADEYDTAFFDKRSKFVHYHPRTLVLNNLEFDHADIFNSLDDIKRQFHHLLRIVPSNGLVITNQQDENLQPVLQMGCWSEIKSFGMDQQNNKSSLAVNQHNNKVIDNIGNKTYSLELSSPGLFNQLNASAALLAAQHAGVPLETGIQALKQFQGVKRRQEVIAVIDGITLFDDFAHHPTAIRATLEAIKPQTSGKLIAVFEPRSNTMKMGVHEKTLGAAFNTADRVMFYDNALLDWDLQLLNSDKSEDFKIFTDIEQIISNIVQTAKAGDNIIIMSNGGFGGIHQKLKHALQQKN
ncbi:MAG: UDP-N-acetylmuramate:L-alanyl-gamma-D-glutamyl-meso-diaminopimelate ligase [Gammaproteobacteria bacterium]|jgi:UDP-N-acetylmuramate: L-alanyl-gamma-D-glutamyl-meso-diaminopimelate ligase|nr:UDP-N-acetylmuramate:L-alanyl-gamma-D-glutamyl-meso-diaminopimelate ligase [Gammaproteobacteria bacterium]MBT4192852.1 UDP-N-acetylmuramate:L-alanyl-gamma-D-glutamyl-meso-diaminopimelate ligase [Gammaproteobacteria bacterium]MBT4452287.1 UDP-N-acetylmuramate:L-alanyl-gamma-D-glutamyl-meso-diaminopimelate ligase [Gammaproteobacteria bacterium]MBT6454865.1 UDP-N-acetylmuramate:L-alanyl-gamma-D-glutamyl-meso-diaminopimelate ligase [Gammaproteobacteria bacterium]MBT6700272.1 UDP-N-acetylmuramate